MDTLEETTVSPLAQLMSGQEAANDLLHLRWDAARIPMSHRFTTLAELTKIKPDVIERAQQFVLTWRQRHIPENAPQEDYPADKGMLGQGMLLAGLPGFGKTSLACAIGQEVSLTYNASILFAPMADYVRALTYQFTSKEHPGAQQILAESAQMLGRCANVQLLILDDVGKEHLTASNVARDEFDRLVRQRHRRALPTIITTNMSQDAWGTAYGTAMTSFLFEAFPPITVKSDYDLRKPWTAPKGAA